jgi:hypothetical protein
VLEEPWGSQHDGVAPGGDDEESNVFMAKACFNTDRSSTVYHIAILEIGSINGLDGDRLGELF